MEVVYLLVFLSGCQAQDDVDLRRLIAQFALPGGERQLLEGKLHAPWKSAVGAFTPETLKLFLRQFEPKVSDAASSIRIHGCPRAEISRDDNSHWEWVRFRKSGLSLEEYVAYEQEHNRVFDRHFSLAAELLEAWLVLYANRAPVSAETRSAIQGQLHRLMDLIEELVRPYAPAEAPKKAVLQEILRLHRRSLTEEGTFICEDCTSVEGLTRPLSSGEMDEIATRLRATALQFAGPILIPKATGNMEKDIDAYYAKQDEHELLAQLIDVTLRSALVEIADRDGLLAKLDTLRQELDKVAKEHASVDDRTFFLADERAKAAWAETQKKTGAEEKGTSSLGNRTGAPESQANGQPSSPPTRKSASSILWDPRLIIALLVLSLSAVLVWWTLRRRRAA